MKETVVNRNAGSYASGGRHGPWPLDHLAVMAGLALVFAVSCHSGQEIVSTRGSATCCEPAPPPDTAASVTQLSGDPDLLAAASPPVVEHVRDEEKPAYSRAFHAYRIPDLTLVDQDGRRVSLISELESGPVVLNFVFTTCSTICPVMTATFSRLSRELSDEEDLRLVSISLDPEYDSPRILKGFSRRYGAGTRWTFLTGDAKSLDRTYRAFNAVTGSKFNHRPFTLLKAPGETRWLRIEGMASVADLVSEYRRLVRSDDSFQAGG